MREAEEANRKKLAALEAEQQKLREEERKELEAQIAKVKNDATIDIQERDKQIQALNSTLLIVKDSLKKEVEYARTTCEATTFACGGSAKWISTGEYSGHCEIHRSDCGGD